MQQLNKTSLTAAALGGALLCGAAGTAWASVAAERAAINARYSVYAQALKARDIATVLGMETPDFTHVSVKGKVQNRQQYDTEFIQQVRAALSIACSTKIQQIAIKGSKTTVTVSQSIKATLLDAKGGKHNVVSDAISRDTWIKNSKGWFMQKSIDLTSHALVDGHSAK